MWIESQKKWRNYILVIFRGMLILMQYLQTVCLMLGKEIFDFHSQAVGDVYINSFLIFTQRRYLLFSEATSVLEDLTKSQWHNNHHLKLNVHKTQFCIFSNRNLKDY